MKQYFKTSRKDVLIQCVKSKGGTIVPRRLYKYRNLDDIWHQSVFESNEVYFSSLTSFNDPFDSRIQRIYTDSLRAEITDQMLENAIAHLPRELRLDLVRVTRDYLTNASEDRLIKTVSKSESRRIDHFEKMYGFLCLTPIKDNIVMWAHYANNHKGICVGFDSLKLIEATKSKGNPIVYHSSYPQIPIGKDDSIFELAYIKSELWDYEAEYRLTININHEGERKIILPENTIAEVCFGLQTSEEHILNISKKVKANNPNVKFYKASVIHGTFDLKFTKYMPFCEQRSHYVPCFRIRNSEIVYNFNFSIKT